MSMGPVDDAREAVIQSDLVQGDTFALAAEVRHLRDAMRALIQHAEDLERRLSALE